MPAGYFYNFHPGMRNQACGWDALKSYEGGRDRSGETDGYNEQAYRVCYRYRQYPAEYSAASFSSRLNNTSYHLEITLSPLIIAVSAIILSGFFKAAKELNEDNEMII